MGFGRGEGFSIDLRRLLHYCVSVWLFYVRLSPDFDETWYEWYDGKITEPILNICINYAN